MNQPTVRIVALCHKRLDISALKKMVTLKYELSKVKVKGKVAPIHVTKAYRGSRGIAPLIFNLSTRCGCVVKIISKRLYPWERTLVPTKLKAVQGPDPVWIVWRRERSRVPARNQPTAT